jgi:UDP-N-acetylglucosamine--dolichyl-phosphate N-acetylglucosaminephosphotransferase
MTAMDYAFAAIPLLLPGYFLSQLLFLEDDVFVGGALQWKQKDSFGTSPSMTSQLLAYLVLSIVAFLMTSSLVPHIKQYTLRKGICGKDLGKRGTPRAETPVPEALGIAPGTIFLVCLILCLVGYANSHGSQKMLDVCAALLSINFMLFLGFTDDVLDWPWRYKLVLPTVASLPLLCCYNGGTSIVVPIPLRSWLVSQSSQQLTVFGDLLVTTHLFQIDVATHGTFLDLSVLYFVYMGMLAVFCTNAINIYAGINGLEAGQSYVIGCAILVHNFVEVSLQNDSTLKENHLFSSMVMLIFVGCTLGLLRHNWYPADVFVGDTFCYFAGMTFACVGILGHFSKTLLLFFIPQVINFLWSIPQLFKLVPCPRHRLPAFNVRTGKMEPSTFECGPHEYLWLKKLNKLNPDETKIPNMTVINMALSILGPLTERDLCTFLLGLQMVSCGLGFFVRYYVAQFFF